ncbi:hypothetical protein GCM10027053_51830 [Intrasporangium mesophilum]
MMLDPAENDWSLEDDAEVWHSAKAGIPEAIAEAQKRGLLEPAPADGLG